MFFKPVFFLFTGVTFYTLLSVVQWKTGVEHDFGQLRAGKPVHHVFVFTNISSDTLLLETTRTSCGCTAASYTETPIAPGQTGSVTVEYDAEKTGAFEKKIKVFFDKQRKPEILTIRGEVQGN